MNEEVFAAILESAYECEFSDIPAPYHRFSLRHKKQMRSLFAEEKVGRRKMSVKRRLVTVIAVILAAAALGLTTAAVVTSGFRFTVRRECTDVVAVDGSSSPQWIEEVYGLFPPEGFEVTDTEGYFYKRYQRGEEDIEFCQFVKGGFGGSYNTEGYELQELTVNGCEAFFIDWGDTRGLMWDNGDYFLEITGNITKEEMIALAEGAKPIYKVSEEEYFKTDE